MSEQGTDDFAAFVPHQEVEDPGIGAADPLPVIGGEAVLDDDLGPRIALGRERDRRLAAHAALLTDGSMSRTSTDFTSSGSPV